MNRYIESAFDGGCVLARENGAGMNRFALGDYRPLAETDKS